MIRPIDNGSGRQPTPILNTLPLNALPKNGSGTEEPSFPDTLAGLSADTKLDKEPLREAFHDFVGQTLFGQMLSSMRSTVGKPAYFHGGRGEEVFQQQLDELLVEKISDASASSVADPMFELFQMQRSQ